MKIWYDETFSIKITFDLSNAIQLDMTAVPLYKIRFEKQKVMQTTYYTVIYHNIIIIQHIMVRYGIFIIFKSKIIKKKIILEQ